MVAANRTSENVWSAKGPVHYDPCPEKVVCVGILPRAAYRDPYGEGREPTLHREPKTEPGFDHDYCLGHRPGSPCQAKMFEKVAPQRLSYRTIREKLSRLQGQKSLHVNSCQKKTVV